MKKLLSVLFVTLLSFALVACSKTEKPKDTASTPAETKGKSKPRIAYIIGNLGDKSFSDSGEAGMKILREKGYDVKTIETGGKQDKYADFISDAIDQGYNYIYTSSTYYDVARKLADEHKDVKFVIFDDKKTSEELAENMTVIFYPQSVGSYYVGMLAAAMSKTGTVAVDVGMDIPVISDFVTGYANGIMDWNKAHGTDVKLFKAAVGSWNDAPKMKTIVLNQAKNGADVFFQVAGGAGDGLFEAAMETNTWAIGVDSDQYAAYKDSKNPEKANVILTSMIKQVGKSLVDITEKIEAGEDVWKKTITMSDAISYVKNDFFAEKVPAEVREAIAEAEKKVASGEVKVKSYFDFKNDDEFTTYLSQVQK